MRKPLLVALALLTCPALAFASYEAEFAFAFNASEANVIARPKGHYAPDHGPAVEIEVTSGGQSAHLLPSAPEARVLAQALLDAADAAEAMEP